MRMWALLVAVILSACGDHVASADARPSPTRTPIPWIGTKTIPTPLPSPSPRPQRSDVRECAAADLSELGHRGQGGMGWWSRAVIIGNRSATPCVIAGPVSISYLDASGRLIATAN